MLIKHTSQRQSASQSFVSNTGVVMCQSDFFPLNMYMRNHENNPPYKIFVSLIFLEASYILLCQPVREIINVK